MKDGSSDFNFSQKLRSRKNYNLFGSDTHENIHWGKLFIHLFGECYSKYSIWERVNNKELTTEESR